MSKTFLSGKKSNFNFQNLFFFLKKKIKSPYVAGTFFLIKDFPSLARAAFLAESEKLFSVCVIAISTLTLCVIKIQYFSLL